MRTAFIDTLFQLAQADDRIVLVTGDLGFGVMNRFMHELPGQFVNAGVAEQNMTGMAAGLALSGKIVFTYSIANFPVLRCLEQIRNDVCYHNANVKIVAVGGGMAYGSLGISHHATEDLAIMRALPNILVLCPGDPIEAAAATQMAVQHDGPCYLRIGRAGEPLVHRPETRFELGKACQVRAGDDLTLISAGGGLADVVAAADTLAMQGLRVRVISLMSLRPMDEEAVLTAAIETPAVFTIEEHSIIGGLGGAVSELLMEANVRPRTFKRIGLQPAFSSMVGDQAYLRAHYKIDAAGIVKQVLHHLHSDR